MGLPYTMEEGAGPRFPRTVKTEADIDRLKIADEDSLGYVIDAIKVTKRELNGRVPLIGFAGAPWTIFCYMVEGKGSKTFSVARKILYNDPYFAHKLIDKITHSTINYLKAQIAAGANIVQIFDSWAGILGQEQYDNFSLHYISKIVDAITEVPVIVFAKGAYASRKSIGAINCDVVGLDWNMDIKESRELIGPNKTLQGNLDPAALYADFGTVKAETRKMIDQFGKYRHIANLGHGVYPDMEADKVRCFIDEVKEYSSKK
jgi:uroporphyrinogen decarboxylase